MQKVCQFHPLSMPEKVLVLLIYNVFPLGINPFVFVQYARMHYKKCMRKAKRNPTEAY